MIFAVAMLGACGQEESEDLDEIKDPAPVEEDEEDFDDDNGEF